jgi:hypothetical protein
MKHADGLRATRPLLLLWLFAFCLPLAVWLNFGLVTAAIVGIAAPILWLCTMPSTYRAGGPAAGLLALLQIGSAMTWLLVGMLHLVPYVLRSAWNLS